MINYPESLKETRIGIPKMFTKPHQPVPSFSFSEMQKNVLRDLLKRHRKKSDELIRRWEWEADQYVRARALPSPDHKISPAKRRKNLEVLLKRSRSLLDKLYESDTNNDKNLVACAITHHQECEPNEFLDSLQKHLETVCESLEIFLNLDIKELAKSVPKDFDHELTEEEEWAFILHMSVSHITPKRGAPEHSINLFFIERLARSYLEILEKPPGTSSTSLFPNLVSHVMMYINSWDSYEGPEFPDHLRLIKKAVARL